MAYAYGPPRDPTAVLGRRLVAYFVDGLLVLIVFVVALALATHQRYQHAPTDACAILRARQDPSVSVTCLRFGSHVFVWKQNTFRLAGGVAILVWIVNLIVLQSIVGATVGKLVLGLRVVNDLGRKVGFGRTIVRSVMLIVDGAFFIGAITGVATHPHRRVGDFAAGTYVVSRSSAGKPIGMVPSGSPYVGGYGEPVHHGRAVSGWAPPTAPAPPPAAPGWGTAPPPAAPPAPAAPSWAPPTAPAPPPAAPPPEWTPPAPPPAAPAPAQWSTAAPPAPPPPPSPNAPPPAQWTPPAPAAPPAQPAQPAERQPEAWWDKAIPAESPDAEEPQP